ncbi:protein FAM234B-like [Liolophura sinensis]|uniref:protein FAM234B-like n=1 Tax=Liolophura sinensis TaxID=3198878 RepID=UPI0031594D61
MAGLFGVRSKGNSSSDIKYTELPQHISDDEDELFNGEDDLLFVASATNSLQNGTGSHKNKRNGLYRQGDVIEMGNLGGSPIKRARLQPSVEVRPALFARKCLFIFTILVVGALVIALSVGLPGWQTHVVNNSTWTKLYDEYGTESCIRLHDLDGDGLLDIVFGFGSAKDLSTDTEKDLIDYCKSIGHSFPCVGVLVGLRGKDGQELWRVNTESAVFLMNCEHIDVNQDGKTDCIVSGRQGTIAAINPKTGDHLWKAERTYLMRQWNIYQVSALPDLDGDNVPEILVPHGGEPSFPPEEHNRHAGRLIVLSGKTGKCLGRYLDMPDSKETYMSSVIYSMPDQSQYILFGSGGETVPGDFMAISLRDFYRYVMSTTKDAPTIKGNYSHWSHVPKDDKGIMKLFSGNETGVMVPPVMADVNNDGIKDILMTAFEGKMILFDGKTLNILWTLSLKGYQTYSTPAPGYFDGDDHLDFMTSWNSGTWPEYKHAMMIVVSGADGVILWKTYSQEYNMASPLSLQTSHYHQDAFLFQLVGRTGKKVNDVNGAIHGIGAQRNLTRRSSGSEKMQDFPTSYGEDQLRHSRKNGYRSRLPVYSTPQPTLQSARERTAGVSAEQRNSAQTEPYEVPESIEGAEEGEEGDYLNCAMDLSSVSSEIFLMDRTTLTAPILIWQRAAEIYNYTLTDEDRSLILASLNKHKEPGKQPLTELSESSVNGTLGDFCTVLSAAVLTTGAVGDVDGDGSLDYIALDGMIGLIKDRLGSYIRMQAKTYVSKVNLVAEVRRLHTINIKTGGALHHTGSSGKRFQFLDYDQQKWTQYLGKLGNGVY